MIIKMGDMEYGLPYIKSIETQTVCATNTGKKRSIGAQVDA